MADIKMLEESLPIAPLGLVAMPSAIGLGKKINEHLVEYRKNIRHSLKGDPAFKGYQRDCYLLDVNAPRFGTGEGKGEFKQSIRGMDIYILTDVFNNSLSYDMFGHTHYMSPDDHFQDLKRIIGASVDRAHRVNVIMPMLYEGRQHARFQRESLDCAWALRELKNMGVFNITTFDAHDPRVMNAIPLSGFDNFSLHYQFLRTLLHNERDLIIDKDHTVVISPDEGALERAVYFAGVMGVDTGMFYKRRDYTTIVNGKNPIVAHEFLGDNIDGKDVIIIDDIISSGESMLDTAKQLKSMNAKRVMICASFGLFTNGLEKFDHAYEHCYFDRVITSNLVYTDPEIKKRPYYLEADASKFIASIIDFSNHDAALSGALTPTDKIQSILEKYNLREQV